MKKSIFILIFITFIAKSATSSKKFLHRTGIDDPRYMNYLDECAKTKGNIAKQILQNLYRLTNEFKCTKYNEWKIRNPLPTQPEIKPYLTSNVEETPEFHSLIGAMRSGNIDNLDALIKEGANINLTDSIGRSLLMHAILSNNTDSAKMLINLGANVNQVSKNGNTALTFAKNPELIDLLIRHGAKR